MVGKTILFVLQTILFLLAFALGSVFLPFLPFLPVLQVVRSPGHAFVYDGLLLAFVLWLLIFVIEAARKRLREAGTLTTAALVVAALLGLAMRFGFKST